MGIFKTSLLVLVTLAIIVKGQKRDQVGVEVPTAPPVPSLPPISYPPDYIDTGMEDDPSSTTLKPSLNPMSLFPLPNGPFYGFPFEARQTINRYLPLTVAGNCQAESVYNITGVKDLENYKTELECIFNQGQAPDKVPTGAYYANVLTAFNTILFNIVASRYWSGLYVNATECQNGYTKFVGWNNLFGRPLFPFEAKIEPLRLNLAPGEYNDGKPSLILDYTADLMRSCPDYRKNSQQRNYQDAVVRRRTLNSEVFPANQLVGAMRFIGKQDDGASIYIGKTYMRDIYRPDEQAVTVAFFSVLNYEKDVMRDFEVEDVLPPLKKSFKYMFPGIIDLPFRLFPVDNLITTPLRAFQTMIRGVSKIGRNSFIYANELARGYSQMGQNNKRFQDVFKNDRVMRSSPEPTVVISLGPPKTTPMPPTGRGLFGRLFNNFRIPAFQRRN